MPEYLKDFINEVLESAVDNAARSPFVNVALLGDSGTGADVKTKERTPEAKVR